jgi:hypothetical protein
MLAAFCNRLAELAIWRCDGRRAIGGCATSQPRLRSVGIPDCCFAGFATSAIHLASLQRLCACAPSKSAGSGIRIERGTPECDVCGGMCRPSRPVQWKIHRSKRLIRLSTSNLLPSPLRGFNGRLPSRRAQSNGLREPCSDAFATSRVRCLSARSRVSDSIPMHPAAS